MKFLLGQKVQMTQVFKTDGVVVPVTIIKVEPNVVTDVRPVGKSETLAVHISGIPTKESRVRKPQRGQQKGLGSFRFSRQLKVNGEKVERGAKIDVTTFHIGDHVQVTGTSKGRGFTGVVKRYHFAGGPASHGHKDNLRARGSSGATFPQHVMKGTRMAGRMGNKQVTVKTLEVMAIKPEVNEIWIKGAVPGPRHGLVVIKGIA